MISENPAPSWLATILDRLSDQERDDLGRFLEELLRIQQSDVTRKEKLQQALETARQASSVGPIIREMWRVGKRHAWDERGASTRWGIGGAGAGLLAFGTTALGVAGFGGAISLPIFIVSGAGAALARGIVEELRRPRASPTPPDREPYREGTD